MTEMTVERLPVVGYLRIEGDPALVASRCRECGALYVLRRSACGKCGHAEFDSGVELSRTGRVATATVVYRAPAGVRTPFTSGVVALDGGGSVRTTLVGAGVEDPVSLVGTPVRLTTEVVGRDSRGVEAIGFNFTTQEVSE